MCWDSAQQISLASLQISNQDIQAVGYGIVTNQAQFSNWVIKPYQHPISGIFWFDYGSALTN